MIQELITPRRRKRVQVNFEGKGRTQQHFKDDCDINTIMLKYQKTGLVPTMKGKPAYGDFTTGLDFADCQRKVQEAEEQFLKLPARLRSRFQNDPSELLQFVSNEENRAEAEELGLIEKQAKTAQMEPSGETQPVVQPDQPSAGGGA